MQRNVNAQKSRRIGAKQLRKTLPKMHSHHFILLGHLVPGATKAEFLTYNVSIQGEGCDFAATLMKQRFFLSNELYFGRDASEHHTYVLRTSLCNGRLPRPRES